MPLHLLARLFPQTHTKTPPSTTTTTTTWQRLDPHPSTKQPHPRPAFKINQRIYVRASYNAASTLQQQSYWIKGWRWDPGSGGGGGGGGGQMRYLLTYTPNGRVYGSEAEGGLLGA